LIFFINNKNIINFFFKNVLFFLFFLFFFNIYIDFFNKIKNTILLLSFTVITLLLFKNNKILHNNNTIQIKIFLIYFLQNFSFIFLVTGVGIIKQIIKNTIKHKMKHVFILLFLFSILHQNCVFIVEDLYVLNLKLQQIKLNYIYHVININTTSFNFLKQKSFLEGILNVDVLLSSFFEKNIKIKNSSEFYNFNNQILLQINLCIVYCVFIYYMYSLKPIRLYFLNKEHCLHINI
jgi:hypothetical protein